MHGEFVKIHLFIDGNGKTARLLLNFELMKHGYKQMIKNERKVEYYDALDLAHTIGDYCMFVRLISGFVIESEKLWLTVLK